MQERLGALPAAGAAARSSRSSSGRIRSCRALSPWARALVAGRPGPDGESVKVADANPGQKAGRGEGHRLGPKMLRKFGGPYTPVTYELKCSRSMFEKCVYGPPASLTMAAGLSQELPPGSPGCCAQPSL